jgi:PII-like signaling protein
MTNDGTCLQFYVAENRRHRGMLVYEWLLREAVRLGLRGGSAFRAIAGFGRHHRMHEQHFFELDRSRRIIVILRSSARFVRCDQRKRLNEAALLSDCPSPSMAGPVVFDP